MPQFVESLLSWLTTGGVKIAVAFLIMLVSFPIINRISKSIINSFEFTPFFKSILKVFIFKSKSNHIRISIIRRNNGKG